jgi:hypothetical protein
VLDILLINFITPSNHGFSNAIGRSYKIHPLSEPLCFPFDTPRSFPLLALCPLRPLVVEYTPPMSFIRPEIVLIKNSSSSKPRKTMDPDCAICSKPAIAQCECEAQGLDIAVRQAEQRMMSSVFNEIRCVSTTPLPRTPHSNDDRIANVSTDHGSVARHKIISFPTLAC